MKKMEGRILLSASDLIAFIECRHKTILYLRDLDERLPRAKDSDHDRLIKEIGIEHEKKYVNYLKGNGFRVVAIPSEIDLEEKLCATLEAMKEGADYIYQAALWNEPWYGFIDLLKKVKIPSKFGSFSYEAMDTKLSKQPKPSHIMQLSLYSSLLAHYQNILPRSFSVVLGNSEERSFIFQEFAYYCSAIKRQLEIFIDCPDSASCPFPCNGCSRCEWRNLCEERWKNEDHLAQVANIHRSQIYKLEKAGVTTLCDLSHLDEKSCIQHLAQPTLAVLKSQARLQLTKRETGENQIELLPIVEERGFSRMPKPDPYDLFFDMEGDPHYFNGLEYLFGIYYVGDGSPEYKYKSFWAHNENQEREAFQGVMDFVCTHFNQHPNAHLYHYNHYEETALKRLASKFGTREEALDNLLRNKKLIDLYKIVRQSIRTSASGYSIKDLETFYMGKREGRVANALESIVVYEQWRATHKDELLDQIRDYNEFDCRSTYLLHQWLLNVRPIDLEFYNFAKTTPKEIQPKSKDGEELKIEYEKNLLDGIAEQDRPFRELIIHLLGFYPREKKPQWWAMYERQTKELPDLLDDPDCLADLTLDIDVPAYPEKRSVVHTYKFPFQEHKLKVDDQCLLISTLNNCGTVFSIDEKGGKIAIKSQKAPLPEHSTIVPRPRDVDKKLNDTLYRFADSLIDKTGRYTALESFLKRERPSLGNRVFKGESSLEAIIEAVGALQNSYLFIQGPPGSGKTYTASRIILELIRSGKRIGVSSHSHNAIHTLLTGIENAAKEKRVRFHGQKKADKANPGTCFDGEFVKNIFDEKDVDPKAELIAGTAWFFSIPDLDQQLDYLFIDEAGQVSLANLIAMGVSARNIVLIGDQMQLGQPIRGVHPGSSGSSTLEYLLQGASVVPPDRGIFLGTTWRMHENICRFISDAVYDGQLSPDPSNRNRSLILSSTADSHLLENGVQFIAVDHQNCRQKSEEEGEIVKHLYSSLLEQRYRDQKGDAHNMTPRDILIISPYNVQVNYLESILPPGARVGTVDKIQGQEAEVVLFSMATSSADDLPRDFEFFYSKKRLNVAISRAKTLAILIANPKILQICCNEIEQMRLVNTLCWSHEYAGKKQGG